MSQIRRRNAGLVKSLSTNRCHSASIRTPINVDEPTARSQLKSTYLQRMASGENRTSSSHTRSVRTCTECKQAKVHPKATSSTEYIANYHCISSAAIPKSTFQILAQDASQDNYSAMWTRASRERLPGSRTPSGFTEDPLTCDSRRIEAMSREIQELRSQREGENATLSPETGGSTSLASEPSSGLSTEDNFELDETTVVLNGLLVESHLAIDALKVYVVAQ